MATKAEKLFLVVGFAVAVGAFVILLNTQNVQIEQQLAASPMAVEVCSKIAAKAHGPFSQVKEVAVMEECLLQRDPAYAAAREADMCRQAKASGANPDVFSDEFRTRCFGRG
jgi:hypothetical protein